MNSVAIQRRAALLGPPPRHGLTLVELLTTIAIVAVLIALLLPAVQAARESARRTTCANHLKQLGTAVQLHLDAHKFFPSGGWSGDYTADPGRGYGRGQPGGWAFSLLSYLEENTLRDVAASQGATLDQMQALHSQAPEFLYCPSRRPASPYPVGTGLARWTVKEFKSIQQLVLVTKSDYAANAGDALYSASDSYEGKLWWPASYQALKNNAPQWTGTANRNSPYYQSGVSYYRSEVKPGQITDGLTHTYLIGEKFLDVRSYNDINLVAERLRYGDNQSAWAGYEWDNHRVAWNPASGHSKDSYRPQQDSETQDPLPGMRAFGSAHAGALNMAFCDGSVRPLAYDVDVDTHRLAANREDGGELSF
ncbi:MAG: DUF1559 domain-containing protein [Pirellulales bacterium]|nr:DUF1559 domain-containing protein [Pirellulales bacterium]